jgi:UDP-GlcNAc:undecaprenyl-phosphate GlcNAc-1-phosphate transferase
MTIANSHKGTVLAALIAPVIALGLPIIDTALAIIRRGLKGLPLFRADRKHIHHRLMQRGLSRTKTVLLLYAISVVFLLMAFAMFWSEQRFVPIVFGMVFLVFLFMLQGRAMGLDWLAVGRSIGNSREMRRQTQYAMALSCWLEMEAERQASLDALWEDFTFVARKIGFTRAKVVFSNSHRVWTSEAHVSRPELREHVFEFNPGTRMMVLLQCSNEKLDRAVISHLSELTAEAWLKAVLRWGQSKDSPLGFDGKPTTEELNGMNTASSAVSPG